MFFSHLFGPSLEKAAPQTATPSVAITFDDGPSESTPYVLDALAKHNAKATFFLVGANVERLPKIAARVQAEGHEIGNHTYSHPSFYRRAPWQVSSEIERCQKTLEQVLDARPRLFRPPYGIRWFGMFPALQKLGMQSALWSIAAEDWIRPAEWISQKVVCEAGPGDVILLHDGFKTNPGDHRKETVKALAAITGSFAERGFQQVTMSALFSLK